ncbi:hypothetical protein OS493_035839 [Desmophyllum pertusum]|uniref:Uncharacterized protein n=1 Tax=Desmophyllum pertusum TaxID=174260 RepID=A0A9X0CCR2_9CNID|nr:hypothetical protein OS493_035839 [Desmophyllum pertusum]
MMAIRFMHQERQSPAMGKLLVQDVLLSSTIGLNEMTRKVPFRTNSYSENLAYKKNVPTNRFLVTYSSSIFLDIDEPADARNEDITFSTGMLFNRNALKRELRAVRSKSL